MDPIERIYREWHERLMKRDIEGLMGLYAPDAMFESPLVAPLMNSERGILHGRTELQAFFERFAERRPAVRGGYRTGYFTDGRTLVWEYPRDTPAAEQIDLVEVMEIADGLIQRHRVYWGWFGVRTLVNPP